MHLMSNQEKYHLDVKKTLFGQNWIPEVHQMWKEYDLIQIRW